MTTFLRLLEDKDKAVGLSESCAAVRQGGSDPRVLHAAPESFRVVPGAPFSYWVGDGVRQIFNSLPPLEQPHRNAKAGPSTADNERFLRIWWEVMHSNDRWVDFAKGGAYSPFYSDLHLMLKWKDSGRELIAFPKSVIRNPSYYLRPGLTWSTRTQIGLSFRLLPAGAIFSVKGSSIFLEGDRPRNLLSLLALTRSQAFCRLVDLQMAFGSYEVGVIQRTPLPDIDSEQERVLATLARRAWYLKRKLDTVDETSHAFALPATLRARIGDYNPLVIEMELVQIQSEIDAIAFDLYGVSEDDRAAMQSGAAAGSEEDAKDDNDQSEDDPDDENDAAPIDDTAGLLSWAVGVVFGRYDWRLATAEREAPEEPEPFDPLPTKSPGMLPDAAEPFHAHAGILVDDEGHDHDLPHLLEEVLQKVDAPVEVDTRRCLQREFFPLHLQRYSKSRRKAPIYWPLSTLSGAYTLWLYYPDLTSQTLFTAVNDFIEPKLQQVRGDLDSLRGKGNARSKQEEKQLEVASDLSQELADLRDALLAIAPKYSPNHDDGVQITAAPLWQLFRHKPWQKVLNDTWEKLEQGDYDWSHLACSIWPDRVLRKCHQDRSLAIAHDVEDGFWREVEVPVMRGKKATGKTKLEWHPKALSDAELSALIQAKIKEMNA